MTTYTNLKSFWVSALVMLALCFSVAFYAHAEGDNGGVDANNPQTATSDIATSTGGQDGSSDHGGSISSGDATATTTIGNGLNSNNVSTDVAPDAGCASAEDNDETDQVGQWNGQGKPQCSDGIDNDTDGAIDFTISTHSSNVTASTTNNGELDNTATSTAATGLNTVDGGDGLSIIESGDAFAVANVINMINTSIFNSFGYVFFFNEIFGNGFDLSDFDLSYFFEGQAGASKTVNSQGQPQCTLLTCVTSSHINVLDTNNATVTNSVLVRAGTGKNTATTDGQGPDADATIHTGDAYAAANVFNLVNTNIINSSYLLLAFNNFGDLAGDVILPDAAFFTQLFAHGGSAPAMRSSTYESKMKNDADLLGTTTSNAETGDNAANSTGEGHGEVETGNAYSIANTQDFVNQNYFGGTSVMFMFQVFGNWKGHISDVPAGLIANEYQVVGEGDVGSSTLILVTSQANEGALPPQTPSANCREQLGPVSNCMTSSSFLASTTNNAVVTNNVDVGASTGHNFAQTASGTAQIITGNAYSVANIINFVNTNIVGRNMIFATFNVFGDFKGNIAFGKTNIADIADEVIIAPSGGGGNGGGGSSSAVKLSKKGGGGDSGAAMAASGDPQLKVTKTASVKNSTAPVKVDYKVVVENNKMAGNAYNGVLTDTLTDPMGNTMYKRSWDLGTVVPGDNITLTYSVEFSATSSLGTYKNTARVDAVLADGKHSVSALSSMNVTIGSGGVVLGESTEQCPALITTFLRRGSSGNEVSKLQTFLNMQGSHLPVTGMYGPMTEGAVKVFQLTYATDILAPVGLTQATGNVFTATQRKINSLGCGGVNPMPVVTAPVYTAPHTAVAPASNTTEKPVQIFKQKSVADLQPAPAPATTSISKTWNWISNLLPF